MITACSENKCPSSVCNRYFTVDNFNCSQTSDLRQARGIMRPIAYKRDTHTDQTAVHPGVGTQGDSYEPESGGHVLLQTTGREELALRIIQLQTELQAMRRAFRTYKEQAEPRLKLLDDLTRNLSHLDSQGCMRPETSEAPSTMRRTSALPSATDTRWINVCSQSPGWD